MYHRFGPKDNGDRIDTWKNTPVKILFIIDNLLPGGTQHVLARLIGGLGKMGYQPTVVSLNDAEKSLVEKLRADGADVHVFNKHTLFITGIFRILSLMRTRKFCLLQNFLFYSNNIGRILGRIARVPVVISSVRGFQVDGVSMKRWQIALDRLTNRMDDSIIINNRFAYGFCEKTLQIPRDKIKVIYNGIDLNDSKEIGDVREIKRKLHIPENSIVIGAAGRITIEKGYAFLLDAFHQAQRACPDLFLLIAGEGKLRKTHEYRIDKLGLGSRARLIGYRSDMDEIYALTDIFVLPSLVEGMPNVLLEAMSHGKPVIATEVGGVPEIINDGVNGMIVPPGDAGALEKKILFLAEKRERRDRIGALAMKRVKEHFGLHHMIQGYHELYQRFIQQ